MHFDVLIPKMTKSDSIRQDVAEFGNLGQGGDIFLSD